MKLYFIISCHTFKGSILIILKALSYLPRLNQLIISLLKYPHPMCDLETSYPWNHLKAHPSKWMKAI